MLVRDDGGLVVTFADYRLTVPDEAVAAHPGLERFLGRQVILGIRPSSFEDAAFAPPQWPRIKAEAKVTERLGSEVDVIFAVKNPPVEHEVMVAQFDLAAKEPAGQDQEQTGRLVGEGESQWTASVNPHTSVRPGRTIDLAVDTSELYWFDPDNGQAIARQPPETSPAAPRTPHRQSCNPDRAHSSSDPRASIAKGGAMAETRKLYRSRSNRQVAGVCGGLAQYFNLDATLIRVLFVVLAVLGGSGLLLYVLLWIIVPNEPSAAA
jgi:phage shock protein PspC (stress-responsive transcriptional regulator)